MPIYDMFCGNCGYEGEHFFKNLNEADKERCPKCESPLEKKAGQLFNIGGSLNCQSNNHEKQSYKLGQEFPFLVPVLMCINEEEGFAIMTDGITLYKMPIQTAETKRERIIRKNALAINQNSLN